jgi:hypothetical protein
MTTTFHSHHPLSLSAFHHTMDLQPAWSNACLCGRTFTSPRGYTYHQRNCSKTKKRLSSALEKVREVNQAKKRRIAGAAQHEATLSPITEEVVQPQASGSWTPASSPPRSAVPELPMNDTPLPGVQQQVGSFVP